MISGFEPLDLLQSVLMILRQLAEGRAEVENQYARVVPWEGNLRALEIMSEVFALRPHFEWRGLGFISQSALRLSDAYADWDAELRFSVPGVRVADPRRASAARCSRASSSRGSARCSALPARPSGRSGRAWSRPEGACAAYYNYGRFAREREVA